MQNAGVVPADRRQLVRLPCRIAVSRSDRSAPLGEIQDISLDGLFVATQDPLPQGSVVSVAFPVPTDRREVVAEAEVVRSCRTGMGMRLLRLDPASGRRLRRYVAHLASLVGHREAAARLHDAPRRTVQPIASGPEIRALLLRAVEGRAPHTLIPAERSVRESGRLSSVDGDELSVRLSRRSQLRAGERVFALTTLDYVSYSFESCVTAVDGPVVSLALPRTVHYSERRSSRRSRAEEGTSLVLTLPGEDRAAAWPVLETGPHGLSFAVPAGGPVFLPGTPLTGAALRRNGEEVAISSPVVKHVTPLRGRGLRVGVAHGVDRAPVVVERAVSGEDGLLRRMASSCGAAASRATLALRRTWGRLPEGAERKPFRVVRFASAARQEVVGLLTLAFCEVGSRIRAPLVVIVPGYGGRKEAMCGLATTLVHNFRRQQRDLAVLRIDGTNNLGESQKDPGCAGEGRQTLHYTMSGVVADVLGALAWAKSNRFVDPTEIVVVSVSMASVAVRRCLTMPEGADVSRWIAFMGAADAQNAILHASGHVDIYGNHLRGVKNGTIALLGCMNDTDAFSRDLEVHRMGTLEDARRDMADVRADVTWIVGKHDAFMDPRRVHDLMSVKAPGAREVVEVEAGHVPRSSDEAMAQFLLVTRRIWRHLYGSELAAVAPPAGALAEASAGEWARVRRATSGDREGYWRSYLLGKDGLGFDVLTLSPAYRDLVDAQVRLLDPARKRMLDLGAGTGNVALAAAARRPAEITCLDLVPEALERLRGKLAPTGIAVRTVQANADGGPLVAVRRWLSGELGGIEALGGRIQGLDHRSLGAMAAHRTRRLHAFLRGAPLEAPEIAREAGLDRAAAGAAADLNLLARVVQGRADRDRARSELRRIAREVLDGSGGLPFPDGHFECAACSLVLSYLEHPADTLSELHRVLAPGGTLVASSMKPDADCSKLFLDLVAEIESMPETALPAGHAREALLQEARAFASSAADLLRLEEEGAFRFFGGDELRAMATEVGFEEVEVVPGFGDPPQAVVVRCRRP